MTAESYAGSGSPPAMRAGDEEAGVGVFTNPILANGSADPWMIRWRRDYLFTSTAIGDCIRVRRSRTITGIADAPPITVWTAPDRGPNSRQIWSPQIHRFDGVWYIYYTADDGDNVTHRMFVLRGTGDDPQGPYVEADTGHPSGQLVEPDNPGPGPGTPAGCWAIAGEVFRTPDGTLYILWSGTADRASLFPQNIYIAAMSDPLHITGPRRMIAAPTRPWETRGAPVAEGPMVIQRNGKTFVVYSGNASWGNHYNLGLLTHTDGDLLAGTWTKTGPIFNPHGNAYGTGGFTTVPSPDGTEDWFLYHAAVSCGSGWRRDIRAQRLYWNPDGSPLLGYPIETTVPIPRPSGENRPCGGDAALRHGDGPTIGSHGWGDSFGGARAGDGGGLKSGDWGIAGPDSATSMSLGGGWMSLYRGNPNLESYAVSARAVQLARDTTAQYPKYGLYACYSDSDNFVVACLGRDDRGGRGRWTLATYGVVDGVSPGGWRHTDLPRDFDPSRPHVIGARKSESVFTFSVDGSVLQTRTYPILNGQIGLLTEDTRAAYHDVAVCDISS